MDMEWYLILRWLHIVGACVLLGTGAGIAFFMVLAQRSADAKIIAHVASTVVIADWIFTATAVVLQPITGVLLAGMLNWPLTEGWILLSLVLYVVVGIFWLPVVWMQHRLCNLARRAAAGDGILPREYYRLYRLWFISGFPAFAGVLLILWLMVAKPSGLWA